MIELAMTPALQHSIQLLLTTALSTLSQAGLDLALDRASKDSGPLEASKVLTTVEQAVDVARAEFLEQLNADGLNLAEEAELLEFLHRPELPEQIVNNLLFHQHNFAQLKHIYSGSNWDAIKSPLLTFLRRVDTCVTDPDLRSVLESTRTQFQLGEIEDGLETVAKINREIAGTSAETLDTLRQMLISQQILISQQKRYFEQFLAEQRRDRMPVDSRLEDEEERYLKGLARESDELLLALDQRDQHGKTAKVASLANVYVDLATTSRPSFDRILDRLSVPEAERPSLREKMRGDGDLGVDLETAHGERQPPQGDEDAFEKHPLRPYVEDAEQLQAVLSAPLTALEALADHSQLVLLGDPGSGKSTFVNHMAHTFAQANLGKGPDWQGITGPLFDRPLFPIRIVLRKWSSKWSDAEGQEAFYEALAALDPDISRERWQKRLDHEGTLVLLDGLDEVPTIAGEENVDRRKQILDAVTRFRDRHENCRVLVTCRVKPYTDEYRLQGWPSFELAPLDMPRIVRFCQRWYAEQERTGRLKAAEGQDCLGRLLPALQNRRVLRQMAGTPLLLTMLARVNARARLPEGRVELYEECIDQLLWEWEKSKSDKGGDVQKLDDLLQEPDPPLRRADLERLLWRLTFELHGQSGDDLIDLSTSHLREELAQIHPQEHAGWKWASQLIGLMSERSGLLIATTEKNFTFPHRSFQEYLAARGLLEEPNSPVVAVNKSAEDTWWEVILLACGHLSVAGRYSDVQSIVQELITSQNPSDLPGARRILLAGMAWSEFGHHRKVGAVGEDLHARLPGLLTQTMQCSALPAPQRHAVSLIASDFGDLPEDLDAFVDLPEEWFGYPFQIARYPVSNAQYRRFMEAGGYDREAGWLGQDARKEMVRLSGRGDAEHPWYWNNRSYNRATQPVVGVSWYEAEAYCKWLTAMMRAADEISEAEEVRLPTFEERKKAAEGATERKFPWDGEEEVHRLNCKESKIGLASPVHMYPDGATPEGVWDLSGNIWEWTSTKEEQDYPSYALGGGSRFENISLNTSAARDWHFALNGWYNVGFRVSVSPLLL